MPRPLSYDEYLSLLAKGIVGNPPDPKWWKTSGPGGTPPPLAPEIFQQVSNLRLFCLALRNWPSFVSTAECYSLGLSFDDVKSRLWNDFYEDIWEECQKICPSAALDAYKKYYRSLPDFPEFCEEGDNYEWE